MRKEYAHIARQYQKVFIATTSAMSFRRPTGEADVPLAGYSVRLDMTVPRFFCDNECCKAITFAERMYPLIESYAHRTKRLAGQQQRVAFVLGGEAGASLLSV